MDRFGVDLGSIWGCFGIDFGSIRGRFAVDSGPSLVFLVSRLFSLLIADFRASRKSSWSRFWVDLGAKMSPFGSSRALGQRMGDFVKKLVLLKQNLCF